MDMDIRIPVGIGNLIIVNFGKPVIGRDCPGVAENEAAQGIGHRGILLYPPVLRFQILVNQGLVVKEG